MGGLGLSAIPSEVWESEEVIKLDLSRNSIQELPVELSSCVSLQVKHSLLILIPERCFTSEYSYLFVDGHCHQLNSSSPLTRF
jgi:hypothetical protein